MKRQRRRAGPPAARLEAAAAGMNAKLAEIEQKRAAAKLGDS